MRIMQGGRDREAEEWDTTLVMREDDIFPRISYTLWCRNIRIHIYMQIYIYMHTPFHMMQNDSSLCLLIVTERAL